MSDFKIKTAKDPTHHTHSIVAKNKEKNGHNVRATLMVFDRSTDLDELELSAFLIDMIVKGIESGKEFNEIKKRGPVEKVVVQVEPEVE